MLIYLTIIFIAFRSEEGLVQKKLSNLAGRKCIPLLEMSKQPIQENYYETGSESEDDISLPKEVIFPFYGDIM